MKRFDRVFVLLLSALPALAQSKSLPIEDLTWTEVQDVVGLE